MAGRIRTIKPELLENARTGKLDDEAWRLYVSLFLLADDYGNTYGEPGKLCGQVFWNGSPRNILETLARLSRAGLVQCYTVRGQQYVSILGWSEHQRVDKPGKPRVPGLDQADTDSTGYIRDTLANIPETLAPDLRPPTMTSDHDHERKARANPVHNVDLGKPDSSKQRASVDRQAEDALTILEALNAARGRAIQGCRPIRPTYSSLAGIAGRLDSGRSVDECLLVVANCEAESRFNSKSREFFDAVSPWRPENFERRLAANPGSTGERSYANYAAPRPPVTEEEARREREEF